MTAQPDATVRKAPGPAHPDFFIFAGAGSFGGEFRYLRGELGTSTFGIRYPGRFGKDFGCAAGSFAELVDSCAAQVSQRGFRRPVLVGHSFGAYVAYAVAARLAEAGRPVAALVPVGATAPNLLAVPESIIRDRTAMIAYLTELMPEPVTADWQDVTVDLATQDLRLLTDFMPAEYPRLDCPIHATRGEADPLTTTLGIREWRDSTAGQFSHRIFEGGHAHLLARPEFISWLREIGVGDAARRS